MIAESLKGIDAMTNEQQCRDALQQAVSDFRKATFEFARGMEPDDHKRMIDAQNRIFEAFDAAVPKEQPAQQPGKSAEQQARDLLERMEVPSAQDYSAGELVDLANLIAERNHLQKLLAAPANAQPSDAPKGRSNMSITVDVSEAKKFIEENYAPEIDRLTAVATGIAWAIWEEFYKATLPQWKPLQQDLSGVLSQISNLIAGLKQKPTNVHEAVNRFLAWPVPNTDRIGTHLLNADEAKAMFLHCLGIDA